MIVKPNLELLGTGANFNIFTLTEKALEPYRYQQKDIDYMKILIGAYERSKNNEFSTLMSKYIDQCIVIDYPEYSLPGSCTENFIPIVNLAPLKATIITDLQPANVYAAFIYTILFTNYAKNKAFKDDMVDTIVLFYFNIFMNMYGKSSGLIGSFSDLVPKLRFLIYLYVNQCLFGNELNDKIINKISAFLAIDKTTIQYTNYDFSSPVGFLRCVKANNIIAISENSFSTAIIKFGGLLSVPMFEDVSRLFSTLLAIDIKGNTIFSNYWSKKSPAIYEKMRFYGMRYIK